MADIALSALVDIIETLIRYVDERYGRAVAWAVSILGCSILIGLPALIIFWLVR